MTSITTREIRHEQHRALFMLQTFISVTTCVGKLRAFKVSVFSTSPELAGWWPLGLCIVFPADSFTGLVSLLLYTATGSTNTLQTGQANG